MIETPTTPEETRTRINHIKLVVCLILMGTLFFWMHPSFVGRLSGVATNSRKIVYILLFLTAFLAVLSCVFARKIWVVPALVFFLVNLLIDTTFRLIKGRPSTLTDAQMMLESAGNIRDVISQYGFSVMKVIAAIAAMLALIIWGRFLVAKRASAPLLLSMIGVSCFYLILLLSKGEQALVGFPSNFTPALGAMVLTSDSIIRSMNKREETPLILEETALDPTIKHVVMVIDESIEASAFDSILSGTRLEFARNLGSSYSYSNSSASSNLMLRRGMDPRDPERSFLYFPSLFQIAKTHGFSTAYMDIQDVLGDPAVQNYFDEKEKSYIGKIFNKSAFGKLAYQRDANSAKMLVDYLGTQNRSFTIIQKRGVHFPYSVGLSPESSHEADPYAAAVKQNTISFLQALGSDLPLGTVVFYTSDHGQNFKGRFPHGNLPGECSLSEWTVPIMVIYSRDLSGFEKRIDTTWQDRADHAAMAETIRNLLGSRNPAQESLLTAPSAERASQTRAFYGSPRGLFGRSIPYLVVNKAKKIFKIKSPA